MVCMLYNSLFFSSSKFCKKPCDKSCNASDWRDYLMTENPLFVAAKLVFVLTDNADSGQMLNKMLYSVHVQVATPSVCSLKIC